MKRKLNGLLSLWLAAIMILSSVAVFAEEKSDLPENGSFYVYIGSGTVEEGAAVNEENSFVLKENVALNVAFSTLNLIENTEGLIGWDIWIADGNQLDYCHISYNNEDTLSASDYTLLYNFNQSFPILVPVYKNADGYDIYLYNGTTPITYTDSYTDENFDKKNINLSTPLNEQLSPVVPNDGYILSGWNLWQGNYTSGGIELSPSSKQIDEDDALGYSNYIEAVRNYGSNYIEPSWDIKYKITNQPTASSPYVKVNYPKDVVSYQWYEADPIEEISDKNATAADGSIFSSEGTSSYSAKTGWTAVSNGHEDAFGTIISYANAYFTISLKAGDVLHIKSENDFWILSLINSSGAPIDEECTKLSDGIYVVTVPEDGTYTLISVTEEADSKVTAELIPFIKKGDLLEEQIKSELNTTEIGTYICEITFKHNDISTNEPIKLYSDRVTTTDVGPEDGQLTISFDANGGSGTMKNVYVDKYDKYELPECGFDAPEDMVFDCWEINGETYEPDDEIEVRKDIEVKALWREEGIVATPEFSPDGGTFRTSALDVKISCDTPRVTIYYTTNGEDPRDSSKRKKYEGNVYIKADTTIKAYAVKDGMEDSEVATAFFDKRATSGGSSSSSSGSSYGGSTSIKTYTIKFNTKGGLTVPDQYISRNKTVKEPEKVTKYGYTFEGWYTDDSYTTKYDFDTPVTKSFTLYAKWSEGESSGNSSGGTLDNRIILTIGQYKMLVFGKEVVMDVVPQIVNDRTMLPARHVAEALGATVEWNESEPKKVRITKDNTEIILWIDSDTAYLNGEAVTLDSRAFLENDRTYTPVRFICENLGATVDWEEGEQKVIILADR